MPATLTHPGVYIEEVPSGSRTIAGVGTSITAFVGFTAHGPVNRPTRVTNIGEFERTFGPLRRDAELSYALRQYFVGGGTEAFVVRVADGAQRAAFTLASRGGAAALVVRAASEGAWGTDLQITVDYDTASPGSFFNLAVVPHERADGELRAINGAELHRNLSMNSGSANYAPSVVNAASRLIALERPAAALAAINGAPAGYSESAPLTLPADLGARARRIGLIIDGDGPRDVKLVDAGQTLTEAEFVAQAQARIRAANPSNPAWKDANVGIADGRLKITAGSGSGTTREASSVRVVPATRDDATKLLLLGAQTGTEREAAADVRPLPSGSVARDPVGDAAVTAIAATDKARIVASGGGLPNRQIDNVEYAAPATPGLQGLAAHLQERINLAAPDDPRFAQARVSVVAGRVTVLPGGSAPGARLDFDTPPAAGSNWAAKLNLTGATATDNPAAYTASIGDVGAQSGSAVGVDGNPPAGAGPVVGDPDDKTGLYALEDVDLFNLLCVPLAADLPEADGVAILNDALALCVRRRAFLIVDPPRGRTSAEAVLEWAGDEFASTDAHRNAAIYYPRVEMPDPLDAFRPRAVAASPSVAALYARTDSTRGIWKAPAGTDASLANVVGFADRVNDSASGLLNQAGVNALRRFPAYGRVAWGARTHRGADAQASEWKYVPVRRLALYIEESLFRGTHWVVFEGNDEPLWSQIRLNAGGFMNRLFRQGAFQGVTPKQAYFVKCDAETTTQDDIDRGVVNILVGFAPLKPAEFVVIHLQQIAGQGEA